jgi:hypothetical protein
LAYEAAEWSELFVAAAGASAALAGLLFVAVSINVERILQFQGLPERALAALLLLGVLVISIIGLIPARGTSRWGSSWSRRASRPASPSWCSPGALLPSRTRGSVSVWRWWPRRCCCR